MNIFKGTFHYRDGKFWVTPVDPFIKVDGKDDIPLCDDDQFERKLYLKESMQISGEIVEFEIKKTFFDKETGYSAKLVWPEQKYTLEDVLAAVKYGFEYSDNSQHDGEVPVGNTLQWLMARKGLTSIPLEWVKYKQI